MVLAFLRDYAKALALLFGVGILLIAAALLWSQLSQLAPEARPTEALPAPYNLQYAIKGGERHPLTVDAEGQACDALKPSTLFVNACRLARYLSPLVIAGEAFGRLNTEDTPSFEAIKWRAFLEDDASFCDRAGLLGVRLDDCHAGVQQARYVTSNMGVEVVLERPAAP